jgi:hypothetical protein
METTTQPSITEEIFTAFSNIAGHLHMAQGWIDSIMPHKAYIYHLDTEKPIMPQLIKTNGEMRIMLKYFSKFLRDDADAIDIMYENIGRSVASLSTLPLEKRRELIEKINTICIEAQNN